MEPKKQKKGYYVGLGIALGLPLGIPVGLVIGNIAFGPAIGLIIGTLIGLIMEKHKNPYAEEPNPEETRRSQNIAIVIAVIGLVFTLAIVGFYFLNK